MGLQGLIRFKQEVHSLVLLSLMVLLKFDSANIMIIAN